MSEDVSFASDTFTHYAYPKIPDTIPDPILWTILIVTGPTIHVILRLAASDYNLGTLTFVRIYGTIPPVISILTSSMKFAICEPRPNLLSRCLFNKSDVITGMNISDYANRFLGHTFNLSECPNTDRSYVVSGLLSMPSGHASHTFGIFTFIYRLVSLSVIKEMHPYVLALAYIFPIICSGSRVTDHQHHLQDIVIGSLMGIFMGDLIFNKMMPKMEKKKVEPSYGRIQ